jgi:hypothetical protein
MDSHFQESKVRTFGQKLVGVTETPSNNEKVDKIKNMLAETADMLKDHVLEIRNTTGLTTMGADLFSATINQIIMTQLMTEKFLTFLEEGTQFNVFGDQEAEEQ